MRGVTFQPNVRDVFFATGVFVSLTGSGLLIKLCFFFLSNIAAIQWETVLVSIMMSVHWSLLNIFIDCMMRGFKLTINALFLFGRVEEGHTLVTVGDDLNLTKICRLFMGSFMS